ncbi:MAG: hypothetical protein V3V26_02800 [Candidatus Aenigmarchaeota archaeon]
MPRAYRLFAAPVLFALSFLPSCAGEPEEYDGPKIQAVGAMPDDSLLEEAPLLESMELGKPRPPNPEPKLPPTAYLKRIIGYMKSKVKPITINERTGYVLQRWADMRASYAEASDGFKRFNLYCMDTVILPDNVPFAVEMTLVDYGANGKCRLLGKKLFVAQAKTVLRVPGEDEKIKEKEREEFNKRVRMVTSVITKKLGDYYRSKLEELWRRIDALPD